MYLDFTLRKNGKCCGEHCGAREMIIAVIILIIVMMVTYTKIAGKYKK